MCPVALTCILIHDDSTTGRGEPNSDVLTREITTSSPSTLKVSRSQLTGPMAEWMIDVQKEAGEVDVDM